MLGLRVLFCMVMVLLSQTRAKIETGKTCDDCTCAENNGGCSNQAVCTDNEGGGVTCSCKDGFAGDGFTCTASDDGWILIQRGSTKSTVSFNQDWAAYRDGFGSPHGDDNYWRGLQMIRCLCGEQRCRLKVEVQRTDGHWYTAEYSTFSISDEADKYRLSVGGYSGDAGDAFNNPYHPIWTSNGMRFSTKDSDNDQYGGVCAVSEGWWFNWCTTSSLNRLHAIWSDAEAIADVQASRMWLSTDEVMSKALECELPKMQSRSGNRACTAPPDTGECRATIQKFYYDPRSKQCKMFIYGGCQGNANNYPTKQECLRACYEE